MSGLPPLPTALLWAAFVLALGWLQLQAVAAADRHVADRFRPLVTRYSGRSLILHVAGLLLLGLLLVAALAESSRRPPPGEGAASGRLLLIFDASASMWAEDVEPLAPETAEGDAPEEEKVSRFRVARQIGQRLVREVDGLRFAVASFSGEPTLNLPMTSDRALVLATLEQLDTHNYYRNTGSSLPAALEMVFHFVAEDPEGLQVVLLGDGEQPYEESYEEPLAGLARIGVPVHAVAIGSLEGQGRVIWDFRDVEKGKEEKRALREYVTRRVDRHFAIIASRTGGRFRVGTVEGADDLVDAIRSAASRRSQASDKVAGDRRVLLLLLLVLAGFLAHAAFLSPAPASRRPGHDFDLDRVGSRRVGGRRPGEPGRPPERPATRAGAAALVAALGLLAASCGDGLGQRAHRANESALALDELGQHEAARRRFEEAASFGFRPEVPIHNLARSLARRSEFTEAHELFQRALELDPELVDAHFNDGVTLYEWGRAELDPRGCQLERTLELWQAAGSRFAAIAGGVLELDEPAARAGENLACLQGEIAALESRIAEPPPECDGAQRSAAVGGGSAGAGAGPADGGAAQGEDAPPAGGGEPPSGRGPLSDDELAQIGRELKRIARQSREPGKFHRRTRAEQFSRADWSDPDPEIWW